MKRLIALALLLTLSLATFAQQGGMGPGPGVKSYAGGSITTFVNDTFTGTNGTLLESHTGETGATWTKHPSFTESFTIESNRAAKNAATAGAEYTASGIAGSLNYTVETVIIDIGNVNRASRACGWVDTAADDAICVGRQTATVWELTKIIGGSATQQDTLATSFSAGASTSVKVTRSGDNFEWFVDTGGGYVSQGTFAITDANFQAAGLPNGVGWVAVRSSNSHSGTGYHFDRITAWF